MNKPTQSNTSRKQYYTRTETDGVKKKSSNFNVTMGSFDGAKICKLVLGLFLHSQLQHLDITIGLYRDDGLATTDSQDCQKDQTRNMQDLQK